MRKIAGIGLCALVACLIGGLVYAAADKERISRQVFDELMSRGNESLLSQLYAPGCKVHFRNWSGSLQDAVAEGRAWRNGAPDLVLTPERVSVNGDFATVQWTGRGTYASRQNKRGGGHKVVIHGSTRFRFVNGKIAEVWNDYDEDDLYRQAGEKNPHR